MDSTAAEIAARIVLGWNAGNSLEASGGETAWGNPPIKEGLIALVKASGFDAIRLPASWNQYADQETAKIDDAWLDRVAEVVQMIIDADLYVILNIHWDGGWLESNVTADKRDTVSAKQRAFWQQIATRLRDFDERLIFASANEPGVETAEQMGVLLDYHQTFIDTVRETGGRNAYRVLVVQGPSTDIEKTEALWQMMPHDIEPNRLMMEVHYYTPWNFAGMTQDESWGSQFYYWGEGFHSTTAPDRNATWGEEDTVDERFALMKSLFVDQGIPVVIGEYSATRRSNLTGDDLELHLASRAYYHKYVTQQAIANGLLPFYWDNGGIDIFGSGIFDRQGNAVFDQETLDALVEGAGK